MNKTRIRICIVVGIIVGLLSFSISMTHSYMKINKELETTQNQLADYQADELEIHPCPFCGSEAVELKEGIGWYVRCKSCGATGSSHKPNDSWGENTKTEAIEMWNSSYKKGVEE